jgi:hypothetical protein
MLKIEKKKREQGYCFIISTNDGKFEISFEGNLDLYWSNIYSGNLLEAPNSKSFTITKENYYLYSLFDELYENIKNCNVFTLNEIDISFCEDYEEIEAKRLKEESLNNDLKESEKYNPDRLFCDGIIEWHCDDFSYEESSIVKIKKEEDTYIVIFEKSKEVNMYLTYSVRFRNSGSRYAPFNSVFMRMYNKLIDYDPEYHQTHIEEYLYQKKLTKKIKGGGK